MATLDAASQAQFRQVNRPHPELDLNADDRRHYAHSVNTFNGRLLMAYFVVYRCIDTAEKSLIKTENDPETAWTPMALCYQYP
jgi:wyosine [tRNA(Phe)-imidazoG37] synthetase (radical SAM superfamily)